MFGVLRNHYQGKTTFVVDRWVANGCTMFHLDDLDDIRKQYIDITDEHVNDVSKITDFVRLQNDPIKFIEQFKKGSEDLHQVCELFIAANIELDYLVGLRDHCVDAMLARKGLKLEKFINHTQTHIRTMVARGGVNLENYVNDPEPVVRGEAAKKGVGLDKLLVDPDWYVRSRAAEGCNPEQMKQLALDNDWKVRCAVAEQNACHDILHKDDHWRVRLQVARMGSYKEELLKDDVTYVRMAADNPQMVGIV